MEVQCVFRTCSTSKDTGKGEMASSCRERNCPGTFSNRFEFLKFKVLTASMTKDGVSVCPGMNALESDAVSRQPRVDEVLERKILLDRELSPLGIGLGTMGIIEHALFETDRDFASFPSLSEGTMGRRQQQALVSP